MGIYREGIIDKTKKIIVDHPFCDLIRKLILMFGKPCDSNKIRPLLYNNIITGKAQCQLEGFSL